MHVRVGMDPHSLAVRRAVLPEPQALLGYPAHPARPKRLVEVTNLSPTQSLIPHITVDLRVQLGLGIGPVRGVLISSYPLQGARELRVVELCPLGHGLTSSWNPRDRARAAEPWSQDPWGCLEW